MLLSILTERLKKRKHSNVTEWLGEVKLVKSMFAYRNLIVLAYKYFDKFIVFQILIYWFYIKNDCRKNTFNEYNI